MKYKAIFTLLVIIYSYSTYSQCSVSINAPTTQLNCGDCVTLVADGIGQPPLLNEDFNSGGLGPGWTSNVPLMYNNPCVAPPDGTPAGWFGAQSYPRALESVEFDVSCGGEICFEMRYSIQADPSPCEGPDLSTEGCHVQFSTNNGASWTDIAYYDPTQSAGSGNPASFTNWNSYCLAIPPAAQGTTTKFRWYQDLASGATNDHWGIDNITITANDCGYYYDWLVDGSSNSADTTFCPTNVSTTYNVIYTNGINDTCTSSVVIDLLSNLTIDLGPDIQVNCGATTDIIANPAGGSGNYNYEWNNNPAQNTNTLTNVGPGTYWVDITDQNGSVCVATDTIVVTQITVHTADFSNTPACQGNAMTFTDNTNTGGATLDEFNWDFNNDGIIDGTGTPINYTFNTPGTYPVTLGVSDIGGCISTVTIDVTVNPKPTADFDAPNVCVGLPTNFTDESIVPSGVITNWDWNFDDGNSIASQNPSNTYANDGLYDVELSITSDNGCTHDTIIQIEVYPLPVVDFNPLNGCPNTPINFQDLTVDPSGAASWAWDFDDGSAIDINQNPNHTFANSGNYNVNLEVTSINGCTNDLTQVVDVSLLYTADFNYQPAAFCQSDTDPFPNFDVDNDGTLDGIGGTFSSTAGLVIEATTGKIDLSASTPGTYTVTNDLGNSSCTPTSFTFDVTIYTPPTADISGDSIKCENDPLPSLEIQLTGTSPWTIDYALDGVQNTVVENSNTHTINAAQEGTYVLLSVVDGNGCSGSVNGVATVTLKPVPNVNQLNTISGCFDETIAVPDFTTNPSGGTVNWSSTIDLGFGLNGSGNIVSFISSNADTTTVSAFAELNGCVGPIMNFDVIIQGLPNINYTISDNDGCVPFAVSLENTTPNNSTSVNCLWSFGDGSTQLGCSGATHTYNAEGCYDISLQITDIHGCVNSITKDDIICIHPNPVADFVYLPQNPNVNDPVVHFENQSEGATSYYWDIGGFISNSEENPIITLPAEPAEYPVTLTVYNEWGCSDASSSIIVVDDVLLFFVPNAFTPDQDQYNEVFKPVMTSGFDPQEYKLLIFNRWGEPVFESHDPSIGWDGNYQGQLAKDEVYIWQIEFKETMSDKRLTYRGHVTLVK